MTYRNTLAQTLDRAAAQALDHDETKRMELLAADFRSGGANEDLMAKYAVLADDDARGADVSEITKRMIDGLDPFYPQVIKADDLLGLILREIGE